MTGVWSESRAGAAHAHCTPCRGVMLVLVLTAGNSLMS